MKKLSLIVATLLVSQFASAGTYTCTSSQFETLSLSVASTQKTILAKSKNFGDEKCTVDAKYTPRNAKYLGSKRYSCGNSAFGADGSTEFIISKEILAGAKTGFIQLRNQWDTFTTYGFFCKSAQ